MLDDLPSRLVLGPLNCAALGHGLLRLHLNSLLNIKAVDLINDIIAAVTVVHPFVPNPLQLGDCFNFHILHARRRHLDSLLCVRRGCLFKDIVVYSKQFVSLNYTRWPKSQLTEEVFTSFG
jgi:hypothetical protein